MTPIVYVIGLVLGFILGYSVCFKAYRKDLKVLINLLEAAAKESNESLRRN
jgi:uncharacterized protein YneF (UPF0154 family)